MPTNSTLTNHGRSQLISQPTYTQIWDAINDGTIYSCPSLLSSFIILSFADLKKYKFYYWFAFPAIHSDPSWVPVASAESQAVGASPGEYLASQDSAALVDAVQTWSYGVDSRQRGFFLARKLRTSSGNSSQSSWRIAELSEYENDFFTGAAAGDRYVCFADPSNYENAPGWMLRNLLVLVKQRWGLDWVQILRYRDVQSKRDQGRSMVIRLESKPVGDDASQAAKSQQIPTPMPKITGWERNPAGKLAGRIVNLTEYMDPTRYGLYFWNRMLLASTDIIFFPVTYRLADQSVDLNLKLMKWRISPSLNLEKIKHTKCLLLGAGTLGSYVARNLLVCSVDLPASSKKLRLIATATTF
jgi:ubiquitin-like modifier-activating enzyme ATG7